MCFLIKVIHNIYCQTCISLNISSLQITISRYLYRLICQVQDADRLGKKLGVYKHRMLLLNPKLVSEQTPPALRSWLELIKDSLDKKVDDQQYPGETFRKIIEDITDENLSPEELTVLKDEVAWEKTQQDARAEGEEIGIKKGEEIGIKKAKTVEELLSNLKNL